MIINQKKDAVIFITENSKETQEISEKLGVRENLAKSYEIKFQKTREIPYRYSSLTLEDSFGNTTVIDDTSINSAISYTVVTKKFHRRQDFGDWIISQFLE